MRNCQAKQSVVGHVYPIFQRVRPSKAMEEAHYDTTFSKSPARNAPCPCRSGVKYKFCCARRNDK